MATIDNTLASQVSTFDASAPLARASQIRNFNANAAMQEFQLKQSALGAAARGLQAYQGTPEFAGKWAETADQLLQQGVLDPQTHAQWRNSPSPLMLKSIIAQTQDPAMDIRRQELANQTRRLDAELGFRREEIDLRKNADNISGQVEQRKKVATQLGLQPGSEKYQAYVATGNLPKDTQKDLTASDRKIIVEAEDENSQLKSTVDALSRAKELLGQDVYEGVGSGLRTAIGVSGVPGAGYIADEGRSKASREYQQIASMESIQTMSKTLKGASTDREMMEFQKILSDPSLPNDLKERTLNRILQKAEMQKKINDARINEMRGGTYFKAGGGGSTAGSASAPQYTKGQTATKTNPDGSKERIQFDGEKWVPLK